MQLACPDCGSRFRVSANALGDSGRKVRCAKCRYEWFAEPNDLSIDPIDADDAERVHQEEEAFAVLQVTDVKSEDVAAPLEAEKVDIADIKEEAEEDGPEEEHQPQWDFVDHHTAPDKAVARPKAEPLDLGRYAIWVWMANGATLLLVLAMCFYTFRDTMTATLPVLKSVYNSAGYDDTKGLELAGLALTEMQSGSKVKYGLSGKIINHTDQEMQLPVLAISLVDDKNEEVRGWSFTQPGVIKPGQEINFNQPALENRAGPKNHALVVQIGSSTELSLRN